MTEPLKVGRVRASCRHWRDLSLLLSSFERCLEGCSRIDAHRQVRLAREERGASRFQERLDTLTRRVERELDRVTAELLCAELQEKMRTKVAL